MKTSLVIISTLLVLSVLVPFIIFIYKSSTNTTSIKKQAQTLLKASGIVYSQTEAWRKNFIGISNDKSVLTYISFKEDKPLINNISLPDIKQCNIIKNYHNNGANSGLKNLELEFVTKSTPKSVVSINFFNIDEDLREDFELPRIEKWHQLIKDALAEQVENKMAS
jgi:hypothetical protein